MDNYDVIDFIFDSIKPVLSEFKGYKENAEDGVKGNHYVVNTLPWNENDDFLNYGYVNLNLFVPLNENGMIKKGIMKSAIRAIKPELIKIGPTTSGEYRRVEIIWTEKVDIKEGYECKNVKLLITTDK